jgi:DNA-binding response OmpR family regulator
MEKPFDYEELDARLHALVRRNQLVKGNTICIQDIIINENDKSAIKKEKNLKLTKKEFSLFLYLAQNK